jgi:transposase
MMGERTVMQEALFYSFCLEQHVPADHLLRSIDRFVDLSGLREHLRSYYSETGRPSIDPELLIRMLIIGYCMGIRSERRLCDEVHLNLAYRWFCRLGLDARCPTIRPFPRTGTAVSATAISCVSCSRQRWRAAWPKAWLAEGFAVDASMIKADANRQRSIPGSEGLPTEAAGHVVREYLEMLDDAAFGGATPVTPEFISVADRGGRRSLGPSGTGSVLRPSPYHGGP